jgi:hypothetical protein
MTSAVNDRVTGYRHGRSPSALQGGTDIAARLCLALCLFRAAR